MIEGRTLTAFTGQEPLTLAFNKKPEKVSIRQLGHLSYISEFTTDIRHIPGSDNKAADAI